jgi:hypothetical protein
MIRSSSCQPWQPDSLASPAGHHDGRAAVTPRAGTRSRLALTRLYLKLNAMARCWPAPLIILTDRRLTEAASSQMNRYRSAGPTPTVAEPHRSLLLAVCSFVLAARGCRGVLRIALLGSLTTIKAIPKDADVLVTIGSVMELAELARAGRQLQGLAQSMNLGADIFLADDRGCYIGRICHYRKCFRRAACRAQNCGRREHLNDDLQVVTLANEFIAAPPVILWPNVGRRITVPSDVEELPLSELERVG